MGVMHAQMKYKAYIKILPAERDLNKMNHEQFEDYLHPDCCASTDPLFFANLTTLLKLVTQGFWPVINNPAEFGDWKHF